MFPKLHLLLKKIRTGLFFQRTKSIVLLLYMDKHEYREKALSMLNDRNTYSILKSEPTGKTQRVLNAKLLEEIQYYHPRFFGLPKIHKHDIPLRPIVSFVNTPTYGVSSFLAKMLSPVGGNTENTVKNSYHFAEFVRGKNLKADQVLISFDVVYKNPITLILPSRLLQKD